ncbi:hypothetical protein ZWY2020_019395 [Hordeum vulgare]|nr:hypothetical protein ZWY2020_019395 [Hordeum vulgare]
MMGSTTPQNMLQPMPMQWPPGPPQQPPQFMQPVPQQFTFSGYLIVRCWQGVELLRFPLANPLGEAVVEGRMKSTLYTCSKSRLPGKFILCTCVHILARVAAQVFVYPNTSKSRAMLLNGAVRKGERLVPAGTLDLFMRCTFPVPNARVKATERFEAAYPIIKELALVGTPGSKAVKQA